VDGEWVYIVCETVPDIVKRAEEVIMGADGKVKMERAAHENDWEVGGCVTEGKAAATVGMMPVSGVGFGMPAASTIEEVIVCDVKGSNFLLSIASSL
jgi:hypothetical protein